jgi:hypothetical protein
VPPTPPGSPPPPAPPPDDAPTLGVPRANIQPWYNGTRIGDAGGKGQPGPNQWAEFTAEEPDQPAPEGEPLAKRARFRLAPEGEPLAKRARNQLAPDGEPLAKRARAVGGGWEPLFRADDVDERSDDRPEPGLFARAAAGDALNQPAYMSKTLAGRELANGGGWAVLFHADETDNSAKPAAVPTFGAASSWPSLAPTGSSSRGAMVPFTPRAPAPAPDAARSAGSPWAQNFLDEGAFAPSSAPTSTPRVAAQLPAAPGGGARPGAEIIDEMIPKSTKATNDSAMLKWIALYSACSASRWKSCRRRVS